nr:DUF4406 domain-containing protein [uncultured Flavobacterium sp.]
MKKKIYIAGKVTGEDQKQCIEKFQKAKELIEKRGDEAVNPIEVVGDWTATWDEAMKKCLKALIDCEAIMLLEDWNLSRGAKIEFRLALELNLTIIYNGTSPMEIPIFKTNSRYSS